MAFSSGLQGSRNYSVPAVSSSSCASCGQELCWPNGLLRVKVENKQFIAICFLIGCVMGIMFYVMAEIVSLMAQMRVY